MRGLQLFLAVTIIFLLSGCQAIESIFRAGLWVGVIGVIIVVAIVGFIISQFRR